AAAVDNNEELHAAILLGRAWRRRKDTTDGTENTNKKGILIIRVIRVIRGLAMDQAWAARAGSGSRAWTRSCPKRRQKSPKLSHGRRMALKRARSGTSVGTIWACGTRSLSWKFSRWPRTWPPT